MTMTQGGRASEWSPPPNAAAGPNSRRPVTPWPQSPRRRGGLALFALGLVLALMSPAGLLADDADARTVIVLPPDDQAHLLEEMRGYLEYTTAVLGAVIAGDAGAVQRLSAAVRPPLFRARQLANPTEMSESGGQDAAGQGPRPRGSERFRRMQHNLPQGFRTMMLQMRERIAAIEQAAMTRQDPQQILHQLWQVQHICIACHQMYRLESQ